jgi:hypothetical protein
VDGAAEYLPQIGDLGPAETERTLIEWLDPGSTPCRIEAETPKFFETLSRTYDVSYPEAAIVQLPVLKTGVARIRASPGVRLVATARPDPRVSMSVPTGDSWIRLEFIRFTDVLFGGRARR